MMRTIKTDGETIEAIFGYETMPELMTECLKNGRLASLVGIIMSITRNDVEVGMHVMTILSSVTGLEIREIGGLADYLNKSLSDDDIKLLGTEMVTTQRMMEKKHETA